MSIGALFAGGVQGFVAGRDQRHRWEDRKRDQARQDVLDRYAADRHGWDAERQGWDRDTHTDANRVRDQDWADWKAMRATGERAIADTDAAMARGNEPLGAIRPATVSTSGPASYVPPSGGTGGLTYGDRQPGYAYPRAEPLSFGVARPADDGSRPFQPPLPSGQQTAGGRAYQAPPQASPLQAATLSTAAPALGVRDEMERGAPYDVSQYQPPPRPAGMDSALMDQHGEAQIAGLPIRGYQPPLPPPTTPLEYHRQQLMARPEIARAASIVDDALAASRARAYTRPQDQVPASQQDAALEAVKREIVAQDATWADNPVGLDVQARQVLAQRDTETGLARFRLAGEDPALSGRPEELEQLARDEAARSREQRARDGEAVLERHRSAEWGDGARTDAVKAMTPAVHGALGAIRGAGAVGGAVRDHYLRAGDRAMDAIDATSGYVFGARPLDQVPRGGERTLGDRAFGALGVAGNAALDLMEGGEKPKPAAAPASGDTPAAPTALQGGEVTTAPAQPGEQRAAVAAVQSMEAVPGGAQLASQVAQAAAPRRRGDGVRPSQLVPPARRDQIAKDWDAQFRQTGAPQIIREYMRQGRFDDAVKFQQFMDTGAARKGMDLWAKAGLAWAIGDHDGALDAVTEAYNASGYYEDGLSIDRERTQVFTDPETGDVLGGVVTFRNDATGETFQQVFDDPGKMVDNALFALSPQVAFEAQQAHQKAAAEAAAKARETADNRAWDMGLEIERTARGIHARMMSAWGKERDAVALTGGEAPPMPTMEEARAEALVHTWHILIK